MAKKRTPGSRPGLIRCDHCGEEYSSSYRRCPFCAEYDEYDAYETDDTGEHTSRSSGGKRLAKSNRRGGGYGRVSVFRIIAYIISLAVIAAAIYVVITVIAPLISTGNVDSIDPDTPPTSASDVSPDTSPDTSPVVSPVVSPDADTDSTEPPVVTDDTPADAAPSPTVSAAPGSANGFSLSKKDISFTSSWPDPVTLKVTFTPAGTSGTITWSSSNTDYVTVDQNGKVSAGPQKGVATVTATLDNGVTQTCTVRNQIGSSGTTVTPDPTPSTGSYKLNKTDFTFERDGETTKLKVKDSSGNEYTGAITWSSTNTSIASVSSDGTCTAVGNGTCNIIATLADGTQLKAIARVKNQT